MKIWKEAPSFVGLVVTNYLINKQELDATKAIIQQSIQKVIKILQTIAGQKSPRAFFSKNTHISCLYNRDDS